MTDRTRLELADIDQRITSLGAILAEQAPPDRRAAIARILATAREDLHRAALVATLPAREQAL
jgi:hypothetical protein